MVKCCEEDCGKRAIYNFQGEKTALYCASHKIDGMINLKSKKCCQEDCEKLASCNFPGEKTRLYCASHKIDGMINVKSKKCFEEGCEKLPSCNFPGKKTGLYCASHKIDGMIDVKTKKCCEEDCGKHATYNFPGKKTGLYCASHKIDGMIDVKTKKCCEEDCGKSATYNFPGEKTGLYCASHKIDGMIDVKTKKCCQEDCEKLASCNFPGEKTRLYCASHKIDGMIDVKSKKCKSNWCVTLAGKKYDGYCLYCFMNLFPDKPVSRNYKTKEYAVVDHVKTKFPDVDWITDKTVNNGCSKRRPDLLLDLGYQILIVEVDENQHNNYDCSCENKRIMELSQDVGYRPIVFIRFNPDGYEKDGKSIASCWGNNSHGICTVNKSKKLEWEKRLFGLEQQINYWINPNNITTKTIEIVQLYYDV